MVKKLLSKSLVRLMTVLFLATAAVTACQKPESYPDEPENIIPPKDTDGANQNRWGL